MSVLYKELSIDGDIFQSVSVLVLIFSETLNPNRFIYLANYVQRFFCLFLKINETFHCYLDYAGKLEKK